MDGTHHSNEIDKIPLIDFANIDMDKLNKHEALGLYLIGQITRGRLCELWDSGFVSASDIWSAVQIAIATTRTPKYGKG